MRITWFGGSVFRIAIGDDILVIDPDRAAPGIDAAELVAGASGVLSSHSDGQAMTPEALARWRPRQARRAIDLDDDSVAPLNVWRLAPGALLIDAPGEAGLVLAGAGADLPPGRWADGAVLLGIGSAQASAEAFLPLVDSARPAILLVAASATPDAAALVSALGPNGQGLPVQILEPGLALEL